MEKALIDTSILIEPFAGWRKNKPNYKERSLALIRGVLVFFNERFIPVISLSVLGELSLILNTKYLLTEDIKLKREKSESILREFYSKCEFVGVSRETIKLTYEIISRDERLEPLDALHIASAIKEGCNTFVFIDEELKQNKILK